MNILVTGGCGFIGSNFLHFLMEKDSESPFIDNIFCVDSLTYAGELRNIPEWDKLTFLKEDINSIQDLGLDKQDLLFNFAAESHVDRSITNTKPFLRTNVDGVVSILDFCRKSVGRLIHISTDEVYGDMTNHLYPSVEGDPVKPRNPYSASKAAAEHFVRSYYETFGLDVVITRGSNTYGPRQYPEKIIPTFIEKLIKNEKVPIYGNGSAIRDYMYVDDHCEGIWAAATKGLSGKTYNLGADILLSGNQVADKLCKAFGKDIKDSVEFVQDRFGHDYKYHMDSTKAANYLSWKAVISFDEGIKKTIEWYLNRTR